FGSYASALKRSTLVDARGRGGIGKRAGFRSQWGASPLQVQVLSPASPEHPAALFAAQDPAAHFAAQDPAAHSRGHDDLARVCSAERLLASAGSAGTSGDSV